MHRMLIERIENRILIGTIAFVGIMVLIGWVAINENARMASFTRQYDARAIERGAELFAANCSTCHGTDGLGMRLRAPGLNNPALFGHDYLASWNDQLATLNKQLETLEDEKANIQTELAEAELTAAQRTAKEERIVAIDADLADPTRLSEIARITSERDAQIASMVVAIDRFYNPEQPDRLAQVGWGGTLNEFLISTIHGGRPTSISYWSEAMPAWGAPTGPLRQDQIQDIATYIQNWDKGDGWTLEDLVLVEQFPIIPGAGGGEPSADAIGSDVEAAVTTVAALVGDPARGQKLYEGSEPTERSTRLSCSGCHYGGATAPSYDGMWERVLREVSTAPELAGQTPEHYVIQSILSPGAFIVDGWSGTMPSNFGESMSAQDLADILEFIKSSDANYVAPEQPAAAEETPAP